MTKHSKPLDIAQARVLRALECGGILTTKQLAAATSLTTWKTRQTLLTLTRRQYVTTTAIWPDRYQLTPVGRHVVASRPIVSYF